MINEFRTPLIAQRRAEWQGKKPTRTLMLVNAALIIQYGWLIGFGILGRAAMSNLIVGGGKCQRNPNRWFRCGASALYFQIG